MILATLLLQLAVQKPASVERPGNVVIFLADDIAPQDIQAVPTPNLDRFATLGVRFTNAFACPVCSPARRALHYGRFTAEDSGGDPCTDSLNGNEPPLGLVSLAELDPRMPSGLFGKWHLGNNLAGFWTLAPQSQGWDTWRAGLAGNITQCAASYSRWLRVDDGLSNLSLEYQPDAMMSAALPWWDTHRGPKLFLFSAQLAHTPFHAPPEHLLPPGYEVGPSQREQYEAMIVALDTQLGQVLANVDPRRDLVVFVSDNGTPKRVAPDPDKAKGTTFERGIRVPLVVAGPGFRPGTVDEGLVHIVDVYASVATFLKAPLGDIDGLPLQRPTRHSWIVCGSNIDSCVRTSTLKLRRPVEAPEELYDLRLDPEETKNLLGTPDYLAQEADLRRVLDEFQAR